MPLKDWKTRFWSKVEKNGPIVAKDLGPCWLWRGCVDKDGYGEFGSLQGRCRAETDEKRTHRIAFVLSNGLVPVGKMVLHKCDIPSCVNPLHIFLGDAVQNAIDREVRHRRLSPGDYKISLEQAAEMRRLYETGLYSLTALSKQFSIVISHVAYILRNPKWGGGYRHRKVVHEVKVDRLTVIHKLTLEQKEEIRRLYAAGIGCRQLSRMFGASRSHTLNIIHGRW